MSYDLDLFHPPPHGDPLAAARAAYAGDAGPAVPRASWRERMQAMAAALAAADPTLVCEAVGVGTEEERLEIYTPEDDSILQVLFFPDGVFVHLAYWLGEGDARAAWEQAWRCLEVLEREGGFRTYDPQLDRLLDLSADLDAVLAEYARGVEATLAIAAASRSAAPPAPPRPWWKLWG